MGLPRSTIAATTALALVVLTGIADVYLRSGWFLRFSAWHGFFLDSPAFGFRWESLGTPFRISKWVPVVITFLRASGNVSLHPDKLRSSDDTIFLKNCLNPRRSIHNGFISASIRGRSLRIAWRTSRNRSVKRCGRGARRCGPACDFINGYSPIRAAGVAREFATSIHGEINPDVGSNLLNRQAGPEGELALLGVDGIVVAREVDLAPQPPTEWELVVSTDEGNVFHRRGAPFARQCARVTSIDSRPNEQFVSATISQH